MIANEPGVEKPEIILSVTPAVAKPGKYVAVSSNGVGELNRDTIDLDSAASRKRFVTDTMKAAFPGQAESQRSDSVRDDLERRLRAIAADPPRPPEPAPTTTADSADVDPRAPELEMMPADVRAEAEALLLDRKLLERVSYDIEALGVVGEKVNRLLLYLVGTSSQLSRPLAVITRGASSSGKSFVGERVSLLFPPEVVLNVTSLTTNALYYFPPGYLRHRWIVAGERSRVEDDDTAEVTRALREMLENGRLSKAVPIKEDGLIVTRHIEQDGPIAYSETTTRSTIFAEDANRCLLLSTDEGEQQTRLILGATATAASGVNRPDTERICAVHHALQRMIPRVVVVVPFATAIAARYPTRRIEVRRDFRHLLQLVKAVALLHFRQRERDLAGAVVATLDDYAVAEKLARGPLGAAASGIMEATRQFLGRLREKFGDREFSTTEAKRIGDAAPRTLEGRLSQLNAAGVVEQTKPPKGSVPARWRLTGTEPASGEGMLPTVAEVTEAFSGCERADNTQRPAR